jgi:hypothetical protein
LTECLDPQRIDDADRNPMLVQEQRQVIAEPAGSLHACMEATGIVAQPHEKRGKAAVVIVEDLVPLALTGQQHRIEFLLGDVDPQKSCHHPLRSCPRLAALATILVHPGSPGNGASDTVRSHARQDEGGLISITHSQELGANRLTLRQPRSMYRRGRK